MGLCWHHEAQKAKAKVPLHPHDHLDAVVRSSCVQHYLHAGYSSRIPLRVALPDDPGPRWG
jgi:hypothetical protein